MSRPRLKRTYTVDEASILLGVDRATVYRMLRPSDGRLGLVRQGAGGVRVDGASLWSVLRYGRVDRAQAARSSRVRVRSDERTRMDA